MRAASLMLLACMVASAAGAAERADREQALQEQLVRLAEEHLRPLGLFVERERAWMSLSGPLPARGFDVRPSWTSAQIPVLPLTFDVVPGSTGARPIRATLGVTLLRDVCMAARRLRKGSVVSDADLTLQRRALDELPKHSLTGRCELDRETVALRDIAEGDIVRAQDVGNAPAVMAGSPVNVSVSANAVSVTMRAIALADARVGDQIDVRLRHPTRTLRTRVIGPGLVQLMDGSP
jgi:flagella basal body P-ring formation protein FlgA